MDNTQNVIRQLQKSIQDTEKQLKQVDEQLRQYERELGDHIKMLKTSISDKKRNLGVLNTLESGVQRGDPHSLYQWRRLMWQI